mgnify:CR=1
DEDVALRSKYISDDLHLSMQATEHLPNRNSSQEHNFFYLSTVNAQTFETHPDKPREEATFGLRLKPYQIPHEIPKELKLFSY